MTNDNEANVVDIAAAFYQAGKKEKTFLLLR